MPTLKIGMASLRVVEDEEIKKLKKIKESSFYSLDVELEKGRVIWGGFAGRKQYLEQG